MKYEKTNYNVGTGRAPITKYKQEIIFEGFPAHIESLYKKTNAYIGSKISSTELYDMYKDYAKQNYKSQSITTTKFGLDMKIYLEPYVKRSNGTKYDFSKVTLEQLQEHLYNINKTYYMHINNLDEPPTFKPEVPSQVNNDLD